MDTTLIDENSGEIFKITGNWENPSKYLKSEFSQLTNSDLKFETGKENELLDKVQSKLNKKREEIINLIKRAQSEKIYSH
jgi:hypothetical protein